MQEMRRAASRAAWTAGSRSAINTAMMAITTSNSIRVNPRRMRISFTRSLNPLGLDDCNLVGIFDTDANLVILFNHAAGDADRLVLETLGGLSDFRPREDVGARAMIMAPCHDCKACGAGIKSSSGKSRGGQCRGVVC